MSLISPRVAPSTVSRGFTTEFIKYSNDNLLRQRQDLTEPVFSALSSEKTIVDKQILDHTPLWEVFNGYLYWQTLENTVISQEEAACTPTCILSIHVAH